MDTRAVDAEAPAMVSAATQGAAVRAIAWLALAVSFLLLAYSGAIARAGAVVGPWLAYLAPETVPFDRLLTGTLWLAVLVELAAGDHAWLRALRPATRAVLAAVFAGAMFYALRDTRCELGDGPSLLRDPVGAVTLGGHYTFVEELAGMWLPLRLARVRFLGGTPPVSAIVDGYRIVSIGFGMAYAAAVTFAAARREAPRGFALLMFGHAALLHFTGYVENYVGAFALLAVGFLDASSALRASALTSRRMLRVTLLCALAVLFHGVAVWSVFGLLLLASYARRSSPGAAGLLKNLAANAALGLGTLALGLLLFRVYLTPGVGPVHVAPLLHGGPSLPIATSLAELASVRPPRDHALALLRVGFPASVAVVAAVLAAPRASASLLRARDVHFALVYFAGFLVHQLLWRSTLGTYRDWDLFGFTALPLAYLGARATALLPRTPVVYALLLACCTLGGLSWPLAQAGAALTPRDRLPAPWER